MTLKLITTPGAEVTIGDTKTEVFPVSQMTPVD